MYHTNAFSSWMRLENFKSLFAISRQDPDDWRFTLYEGDPDTQSLGEE
jgi:hypothetical protein